ATQAAALAGYAKEWARNQGYRLLKNPLVLDRIAELRKAQRIAYALERDTILDKLEALFFDALADRNHSAAVASLRLQATLGGLFANAAPRAARPAAHDEDGE
ncbi:MAG: terminase small subunit, partial [Rhodospirillaceae bacterium]|nr:terminase small subunit [Rhodospirillaceae bacterium]